MGIKNWLAAIIHKVVRVSGLPSIIAYNRSLLIEHIDKVVNKRLFEAENKTLDHYLGVSKGQELIARRAILAGGGYVDKGTQILLGMSYRENSSRGGRMPFSDVEFTNYSQTGEDGILWYIFSLVGTTNKIAIEMCAGVGYECNSANLIVNHGWHGVLFDGDSNNIVKGREFFGAHPNTCICPPSLIEAWITAENVNDLIASGGVSGSVDLLSLDLDGVDYWIWDAIEVVEPRVIVLEFQAAWMAGAALTVPYKPDFVAEWRLVDVETGAYAQYGGASLPAFNKLAKKKGYRLVGVNSLGYNAFFVKDGVGDEVLPEVSVEECFTHPVVVRSNKLAQKAFSALDWEAV